MKRHHKWGSELAILVTSRMHTKFEWGETDCALWAADCVKAITGYDPAHDLRGAYSTALEAARVIKERDGLSAIASDRLGERINPKMARIGDIALCSVEGRESLAVVMGTHLLGQGEDGLVAIPMSAMEQAWRCTID